MSNKRVNKGLCACFYALLFMLIAATILALIKTVYFFNRYEIALPLFYEGLPEGALSSLYMSTANTHMIGLIAFVSIDVLDVLPYCFLLWSVPAELLSANREDIINVLEHWFSTLGWLLILAVVLHMTGVAALYAISNYQRSALAYPPGSSVPEAAKLLGGIVCVIAAWTIRSAPEMRPR